MYVSLCMYLYVCLLSLCFDMNSLIYVMYVWFLYRDMFMYVCLYDCVVDVASVISVCLSILSAVLVYVYICLCYLQYWSICVVSHVCIYEYDRCLPSFRCRNQGMFCIYIYMYIYIYIYIFQIFCIK